MNIYACRPSILSITALYMLLWCFLSIFAGGFQSVAAQETSAATSGVPFATGQQKLSYALGMTLGNQFRQQSINIDPDFYLEGLEDALRGRGTRLTNTEAHAIVNHLQRTIRMNRGLPSDTAPVEIKVSFKLDQRLTRSMYMGDRWVSPPTFTIVQEGREAVIEAWARGSNSLGDSLKISPKWTTQDADMVVVVPETGEHVDIVVRSAGQADLNVEAQGISKTYHLKAFYSGSTIQVEISQ